MRFGISPIENFAKEPIAARARQRKFATTQSWRVDETYMRMKGLWLYQYWDIDKYGKIFDLML